MDDDAPLPALSPLPRRPFGERNAGAVASPGATQDYDERAQRPLVRPDGALVMAPGALAAARERRPFGRETEQPPEQPQSESKKKFPLGAPVVRRPSTVDRRPSTVVRPSGRQATARALFGI